METTIARAILAGQTEDVLMVASIVVVHVHPVTLEKIEERWIVQQEEQDRDVVDFQVSSNVKMSLSAIIAFILLSWSRWARRQNGPTRWSDDLSRSEPSKQ